MPIYSGRLDQFDTEESVISTFLFIIDFINATNAVLTFEDETKAGLPCKPHYHFIFESDHTHDYIRRFISEHPELKGSNSSLKHCEDYTKGMIYILKQYPKQQYIPFSDLDEEQLDYYIQLSKQYNDQLKLNNWKEHIDYFMEISKFKENTKRELILKQLLGYIYDWNRNETNKRIDMPTNLKKTLTYIEEKICSRSEFIDRIMADNNMFLYAEEMYDMKMEKIRQNKPQALAQYFGEEEDTPIESQFIVRL